MIWIAVVLIASLAAAVAHYRAEAGLLRLELGMARVSLSNLDARYEQAQARLTQAWRDGYTVPAAVDDEPSGASDPLLSPAQLEWLDQWEDPLGRARWESFLLRRMRAGASADASIADAELQVIRGQEHLLTPQPATSAVTLG